MCFCTLLLQLEEQLAVFIQAQSKSKDMQYRMEVTWEKERDEQKRLLKEAHDLTLDLQVHKETWTIITKRRLFKYRKTKSFQIKILINFKFLLKT